jgi:hypothetical protein
MFDRLQRLLSEGVEISGRLYSSRVILAGTTTGPVGTSCRASKNYTREILLAVPARITIECADPHHQHEQNVIKVHQTGD